MSQFLSDAGLLWRYAIVYRTSRFIRGLFYLLMAVGVVLSLALHVFGKSWHQAIVLGIGVAGGIIYVCAWMMMISGALLLCSPTQARLVPRMRRRAIEVTLGAWLLLVILVPVMLGPYHGSYARTFIIAFGYSLALALSHARSRWTLLWFPLAYYFFISEDAAAQLDAVTNGATGLVLAALLIAVSTVLYVRVLFPIGDRAWKVGDIQQLGERMRKNPLEQVDTIGLLGTISNLPYKFVLQRECAHPVGARLIMVVLGPRCHWTDLMWLPAVQLLIVAPMKLWAAFHPDAIFADALANGAVYPLAIFILWQFIAACLPVQRIKATQAEQGLYRLAPRAPAMPDLNRRLAAAIVGYATQCWLVITISLVGISLWLGASSHTLIVLVSLCALTLPSLGIPLIDYASARNNRQFLSGFCVAAASVAVLLMFLYLAGGTGNATWLTMSAVSLIVTVVFVRTRWGRMMVAPVAFPAGRVGE